MPDVINTKIERNRDILEERTSAKLISVIHQLAYVVYVAERVFAGIYLECKDINKRTDRLKRKIQECNEYSKSINAKTIPVPVGDLTRVRQINRHFRTYYREERTVFSSLTRPEHVQNLYRQADSIPCQFGQFSDEFYSSSESSPKVDIGQDETELENWEHGRENLQKKYLLLSEEKQRHTASLDYPSNLIPIDVTGSSFQKMSSFRRSLIHFDFLIKRKKKRKNKRNIIIINQDTNTNNLKDKSVPKESITEHTDYSDKSNEWSRKNIKNDQENKKEKGSLEISNLKSIPGSTTNKSGTRKGRSFLPISTLSAAMTVAVKLRETSTTKCTEERLINGCLGMESSDGIYFRHFKNSSKSSLGRDSTSSEAQETDRSQDGTLTGYTSDDSAATATLISQQKTINSKNSNCGTVNSNDNLTTLISDKNSTYYRNYSKNQTSESGDSLKSFNEGWMTNRTSSESDSLNSFGSTKSFGSCSSVDTIGNNSINSLLSQTATEISSDSVSLFGVSKFPPLPPLRVSSVKKENQAEKYEQTTITKLTCDIYDTPQNFHKNIQESNHYFSPTINSYENTNKLPYKTIEDTKPKLSSFLTNTQKSDFESNNNNMKENKDLIVNNCYKAEGTRSKSIQHKVSLDEENSKIPLKYVHHVTVTPIIRQNQTKSQFSQKANHSNFEVRTNYANFRSLNFPKSKSHSLGKVIFSSNSLGRRRDGHPMNYISSSCVPEHKFATLPFRQSGSSMPSYGAYVKLNPDGRVNYCNTIPRIRHMIQNQSSSIIPNNSQNNSVYPESRLGSSTLNNFVYPHSNMSIKTVPKNSSANYSPIQVSDSLQIKYADKLPNESHHLILPQKNFQSNDKKSSLTTENLFAVIHDSKKRHNIKTDTDITTFTSNNSETTHRKHIHVKTGSLNFGKIMNRTNQSVDSASINNDVCNRIQSPSKTTSMQKFKMLLLQTNSNHNNSQHKSAVEQLKTLPWNHKPAEFSSTISSLDCASSVFQNHMTSVSTMPFRRNSRMRASLPSRHICPPIWEDHLEESEIVNCKKYLKCLKSEFSHNRIEEKDQNSWIPSHSASAWV